MMYSESFNISQTFVKIKIDNSLPGVGMFPNVTAFVALRIFQLFNNVKINVTYRESIFFAQFAYFNSLAIS